jgi:hypothetical protein
MDPRHPIKFELDLTTMTVRVGVLPSPLSLEASRAWQAISIPELQDMVAAITMQYNQHCRQLAAQMRARSTERPT